jgi:hypothetical protein
MHSRGGTLAGSVRISDNSEEGVSPNADAKDEIDTQTA